MLFVFFHYIDICTDGSRASMDKIADASTLIKWYQAVLLFIFSTPTHSQYQKKKIKNKKVRGKHPISLKNILEAVEIINSIQSQLFGMHLLNTLFDKGELYIKYFSAYWSTMVAFRKSTHAIVWLVSWTSYFFTEHYFYLQEWQTNKW